MPADQSNININIKHQILVVCVFFLIIQVQPKINTQTSFSPNDNYFLKRLKLAADQSNDYPSENQSDAGRSAKATKELENIVSWKISSKTLLHFKYLRTSEDFGWFPCVVSKTKVIFCAYLSPPTVGS